MKNSIGLLAISIFCFLMLNLSCKKETNDDPGAGGSTNNATSVQMTATIGGVEWTATASGENGFFVDDGCWRSGGGAGGGIYSLNVYILDEIQPNTNYPLGPLDDGFKAEVLLINVNNQKEFTTDSPNGFGQLRVTEFNPVTRKITMTFSGTLVDNMNGGTRQVSNGRFTCTPYWGTYPSNSISALVNGFPISCCRKYAESNLYDSEIVIEAISFGQVSAGDGYVQIKLPENVNAGQTFDLTVDPSVMLVVGRGNALVVDDGQTTGTIHVTIHDRASRRIAGTFNCQGVDIDGDSVNVTQGSFDMNYYSWPYYLGRNMDSERNKKSPGSLRTFKKTHQEGLFTDILSLNRPKAR